MNEVRRDTKLLKISFHGDICIDLIRRRMFARWTSLNLERSLLADTITKGLHDLAFLIAVPVPWRWALHHIICVKRSFSFLNPAVS